MSTPKAPRPQAPLTNPADGAIPAAQFERWRKSFESDAALLDEGERTEERLGTAFALWMGYPWLLELIGRNISGRYLGSLRDQYKFEPDPASLPAYHALNHAHYLATNVLMAEAEINGLNPHPLLECGNVVRELFSREPWKYYVGCDVFWPACMGDARYSLPAGQQEAIRAGEEVFVRLALRPKIRSDAQAVLDAKAAEVTGGTAAPPPAADKGAGGQGAEKPTDAKDNNELSAAQVNAQYGVTAAALRRARERGKIEGRKVGGFWRYSQASVVKNWPQ